MFKKYLVIASKKDPAGMNIINQLVQFRANPVLDVIKNNLITFDIASIEGDIVYTENINAEKLNQYDFIIFASKHSTHSEEKQKTLSVHAPGNFREANLGGIMGKVSVTSALFNKFLFQKLNEKVKEHNLKDFNVTMEATHHGPLIDKPCVFIEIGSDENEWRSSRAGFVIAKTIQETILEFELSPYKEIAVGIGGPHYCPGFNKLQLNSNVAFSHIIPGYALPITEEFVKECISKTAETLDFVVLDWKGLGNSEIRQGVVDILEKNYIQWKKSSDINR
jgi:D-aminoacyl-tRNA deacylase